MLKFMRSVPGGLLLIPMLISAIVNTILQLTNPDFFFQLGGLSEALFTTKGLNYIVGAACFFSATGIDIKKLGKIFKFQGVILLIKTIICIILGFLFIHFFGILGIGGITAMTFIAVICSTNPSLYLALVNDLGEEDDKLAFGLVGLVCVPAYPMFVYGLSQATAINWTPIISTFIPIILGIALGNLDKELSDFFVPGLIITTPLMGWSFGAGINLIHAVSAGVQGIILSIVFYIAMAPLLVGAERVLFKRDGVVAMGMTSVAGMSISVPALIAENNPALQPYVSTAAAQIALAVIITSILTPIITRKLADRTKTV